MTDQDIEVIKERTRLETLKKVRALISELIDPWTIKKIDKMIKEIENDTFK